MVNATTTRETNSVDAKAIADVSNCYRYILGREMTAVEGAGASQTAALLDLPALRRQFLSSAEFHSRHLEIFFENLVPRSIITRYTSPLGFHIYLDLRQLHLSFGIMNGAYEAREIETLRRLVPDNGTFIDVGANCGYFSLSIASKPGFHGRVVAFEPLAPLHDLLAQSIVDNGFSARVDIHNIALGHEPGLTFLTGAEHTINAGATRIGAADSTGRAISVDTFDRVGARLSPDVIKVDIEGAEALFLHGAQATLAAHKPSLLVEINAELLRTVSGVRPDDLQGWLTKGGYRLWAVDPERLKPLAAGDAIGAHVPASGVMNVLAIHDARLVDATARLGGLA